MASSPFLLLTILLSLAGFVAAAPLASTYPPPPARSLNPSVLDIDDDLTIWACADRSIFAWGSSDCVLPFVASRHVAFGILLVSLFIMLFCTICRRCVELVRFNALGSPPVNLTDSLSKTPEPFASAGASLSEKENVHRLLEAEEPSSSESR